MRRKVTVSQRVIRRRWRPGGPGLPVPRLLWLPSSGRPPLRIRVARRARVVRRVTVARRARVARRVTVARRARVAGQAKVARRARVAGQAKVARRVTVVGQARVVPQARVRPPRPFLLVGRRSPQSHHPSELPHPRAHGQPDLPRAVPPDPPVLSRPDPPVLSPPDRRAARRDQLPPRPTVLPGRPLPPRRVDRTRGRRLRRRPLLPRSRRSMTLNRVKSGLPFASRPPPRSPARRMPLVPINPRRPPRSPQRRLPLHGAPGPRALAPPKRRQLRAGPTRPTRLNFPFSNPAAARPARASRPARCGPVRWFVAVTGI